MGQVIGPINRTDWCTLQLLKGTLSYARQKRDGLYRPGIEIEQNIYNEIMKKYIKKCA